MVEEEEVARLLAAQIGADPDHLLEDVAVADLRLDRPDARLAQRVLEPEIGHHRGHEHAAAAAVPAARWRAQTAST